MQLPIFKKNNKLNPQDIMAGRRVVVTGIGALTPVGNTAPEFWNGLVSGKSGVRTIEHFDTTDYPTKFAGQIENYDSSNYFERKEARRLDNVSQYGLITADEAIKDSGIELDKINKDKVAVIVGTGIGGMKRFTTSLCLTMSMVRVE